MGVQGLVTGMVRLHGSTTICDIGSGKGYLSHVIGQTTPGVRVVAIGTLRSHVLQVRKQQWPQTLNTQEVSKQRQQVL